jgi:hypothetical protein
MEKSVVVAAELRAESGATSFNLQVMRPCSIRLQRTWADSWKP